MKIPGRIANNVIILLLLVSAFLPGSCGRQKEPEQRVTFTSGAWPRFSILSFEFPMASTESTWDIVFEMKTSGRFDYDSLPLNMVLRSPSGEERIREIRIEFRNFKGVPTGVVKGDTCISTVILKRGLYISGKGMLKVEIENLNPRIETEGVISAAVRLIPK